MRPANAARIAPDSAEEQRCAMRAITDETIETKCASSIVAGRANSFFANSSLITVSASGAAVAKTSASTAARSAAPAAATAARLIAKNWAALASWLPGIFEMASLTSARRAVLSAEETLPIAALSATGSSAYAPTLACHSLRGICADNIVAAAITNMNKLFFILSSSALQFLVPTHRNPNHISRLEEHILVWASFFADFD